MKFLIKNQQVHCIPTREIESLSMETLSYDQQSLTLYSVFKRFKRGRSKHTVGDNCPMLYALKGLDGLTVSIEHQNIFYDAAVNSVIAHFQNKFPFDRIVLLPSSHHIARQCAERLTQHYSINLIDTLLQKKTNQQVKQDLLNKKQVIEPNIHRILMNKMNESIDEMPFALKTIPVRYRHWIEPFILCEQAHFKQDNTRILLIDDICSSGISLFHAQSMIQQQYPSITVSALTLFGKI